MDSLAFYFSILLAAFSPQICLGVFRNVPVPEMPNATSTTISEIETSVQKINEKAAKFVSQVQTMLQKLNTSATKGTTEINNSLKSTLASFQSDISKLNANADSTVVNECEDYVSLMKSSIPQVLSTIESCTKAVINEANERIALTLNTVDSKLDGITAIQQKAAKCTDNVQGTDNETDESEVRKAYTCAKQTKALLERTEESFSYVIDFVTTSILYRGWANKIGCCTSMSEAESFKYATELLYTETESCLMKAGSI